MSPAVRFTARQARLVPLLSLQKCTYSPALFPITQACRTVSTISTIRVLPFSSRNLAADSPQHGSRPDLAMASFISNALYIKSHPARPFSSTIPTSTQTHNMTTASFKHIDTSSYTGRPWSKVDGPGNNFKQNDHNRDVNNLRGREHEFTTDNAGFAVHKFPAKEKLFTDEQAVREGYYSEVEGLLRAKYPGIKKVVIFDHTIRRRIKDSPRQPVQQVHVSII